MAFLQSVLPDMKAMDDRQKMRFKRGVLRLAEEILYPETVYSAESSVYAQSKSSSITALARDSSMNNFECASPMPTDDDLTSGDQSLNIHPQIEEAEKFNIGKYLNFLPK